MSMASVVVQCIRHNSRATPQVTENGSEGHTLYCQNRLN